MRSTTALSAGLFAAWVAHDAEELITMAATSRRVIEQTPRTLSISAALGTHGLSQAHVNLSIGVMSVPVAATALLGVRTRARSRWFRGAVLAFGIHGFTHLGSCAALRGYTTGAATAPVIVIPYWLLARRTLRRHGLGSVDRATTVAAATWLPLTVGAHLLASGILARSGGRLLSVARPRRRRSSRSPG